MTADFPFRDGDRFTIDDDQFHSHTVMCRHKPAKAVPGRGVEGGGLSLVTAAGYPVIYQPDTGRFRIPLLGCFADRRA